LILLFGIVGTFGHKFRVYFPSIRYTIEMILPDNRYSTFIVQMFWYVIVIVIVSSTIIIHELIHDDMQMKLEIDQQSTLSPNQQ